MNDNKEGDWEYWKKQNYYIVDKSSLSWKWYPLSYHFSKVPRFYRDPLSSFCVFTMAVTQLKRYN